MSTDPANIESQLPETNCPYCNMEREPLAAKMDEIREERTFQCGSTLRPPERIDVVTRACHRMAAMLPVIEAAEAIRDEASGEPSVQLLNVLDRAVDAYREALA